MREPSSTSAIRSYSSTVKRYNSGDAKGGDVVDWVGVIVDMVEAPRFRPSD
jgi:hypothetical protein